MKEYFLIYNLAGDLTITAFNQSDVASILDGTDPTFPPEDCIGSSWDRVNIDDISEGKFVLIKGMLIMPRPMNKMIWRGRFD